MRLYGIRPDDVAMAVSHPTEVHLDEGGNSRLTGFDGAGGAIIVVVARDDSDFVITTYPDD